MLMPCRTKFMYENVFLEMFSLTSYYSTLARCLNWSRVSVEPNYKWVLHGRSMKYEPHRGVARISRRWGSKLVPTKTVGLKSLHLQESRVHYTLAGMKSLLKIGEGVGSLAREGGSGTPGTLPWLRPCLSSLSRTDKGKCLSKHPLRRTCGLSTWWQKFRSIIPKNIRNCSAKQNQAGSYMWVTGKLR